MSKVFFFIYIIGYINANPLNLIDKDYIFDTVEYIIENDFINEDFRIDEHILNRRRRDDPKFSSEISILNRNIDNFSSKLPLNNYKIPVRTIIPMSLTDSCKFIKRRITDDLKKCISVENVETDKLNNVHFHANFHQLISGINNLIIVNLKHNKVNIIPSINNFVNKFSDFDSEKWNQTSFDVLNVLFYDIKKIFKCKTLSHIKQEYNETEAVNSLIKLDEIFNNLLAKINIHNKN